MKIFLFITYFLAPHKRRRSLTPPYVNIPKDVLLNGVS